MKIPRNEVAVLVLVFLMGCRPFIFSSGKNRVATPTILPATIPKATALSTSLPLTTPNEPISKRIVFCSHRSPSPTYIYFNNIFIQREFLNAVAPEPIVALSDYQYRTTILEKLPSFEDGDAWVETVTVREGDLINDDAGEVVELLPGVIYRPSACRDSSCALNYEGGEVQLDRMVVTFRLLRGLKWSDGKPLTSADSVFAYKLTQRPGYNEIGCIACGLPFGADSGAYDRTAEYIALDDLTVRWTGIPGYLTRSYFLNFFSPLPEHILKELDLETIYELEFYGDKMMLGWGPFMVDEWEPGGELRLVRNPYYYRAGQGFPLLDEILWITLDDDWGHGLAGVLTRKCDLVSEDALFDEIVSGNALQYFQGIRTTGELRLYVLPVSWDGIAFRINVPAEKTDFFSDVRVRNALAFGTDRKAIGKAIAGASFLVAESYVPSNHPVYAEAGIEPYPYSVQRARELLAEAGWADNNGDGIVEKDGKPFIVTLLVPYVFSRSPGVSIFQLNMADIGIKVQIEFLKLENIFGENSPLVTQDFDLYWGQWPIFNPPDGFQPACNSFITMAIPETSDEMLRGNFNVMGYQNPDFDTACLSSINTLDSDEALRQHIQALRIFNQDLPVLPLYFWPAVVLSRQNVSGLMLDSEGAVYSFEGIDLRENP